MHSFCSYTTQFQQVSAMGIRVIRFRRCVKHQRGFAFHSPVMPEIHKVGMYLYCNTWSNVFYVFQNTLGHLRALEA